MPDRYLYLSRKKRPKYQKTMQIRPKKKKKGKIPEKTPKIFESHRNTTEKREKQIKLGKK